MTENIYHLIDNRNDSQVHFTVTYLQSTGNVLNIIGLCLQLFFVTFMAKHVFRSTLLLNFAMSFMISHHCLQWFYGILCSFYRHHVIGYPGNMENITKLSTFGVSKLTGYLPSVLIPIKTEYHLLVVGFLLSMWDSDVQNIPDNGHKNRLEEDRTVLLSKSDTVTFRPNQMTRSSPYFCKIARRGSKEMLSSSYPRAIKRSLNLDTDVSPVRTDICRTY